MFQTTMQKESEIPDVSPELPSTAWRVVLAALSRLPQAGLSRTFGAIADTPLPPAMRATVLGGFARAVGINVQEAEKPIEQYSSINDFFVRRLADGLRRIPNDSAVAASPVDGVTGQFGTIQGGRLLQAKGRWYSAAELIDDAGEAAQFENGTFITLYLSPRHYHRIHSPCDGKIPFARHIPGGLLPVNRPAVTHVSDLFARNERLLCAIDGPLGRVIVVAVGAYNVGRISAAFDPEWNAPAGRRAGWVTNRAGSTRATHTYDPPGTVRQGEEIMAFHLGSTVVLLLEKGVEIAPGLAPGDEVRLGQPIARKVLEAS
jgi:phosphatidylserine decarboxylase